MSTHMRQKHKHRRVGAHDYNDLTLNEVNTEVTGLTEVTCQPKVTGQTEVSTEVTGQTEVSTEVTGQTEVMGHDGGKEDKENDGSDFEGELSASVRYFIHLSVKHLPICVI